MAWPPHHAHHRRPLGRRRLHRRRPSWRATAWHFAQRRTGSQPRSPPDRRLRLPRAPLSLDGMAPRRPQTPPLPHRLSPRYLPPPRRVLLLAKATAVSSPNSSRSIPAPKSPASTPAPKCSTTPAPGSPASASPTTNVRFIHADILHWPAPDAQFDLIVTHFFLTAFPKINSTNSSPHHCPRCPRCPLVPRRFLRQPDPAGPAGAPASSSAPIPLLPMRHPPARRRPRTR